jgi:hypothetical protein
VLAVVLAGAYCAYWFITAQILERIVTTWADAQRAHGFKIDIGDPQVRGFPVAFRMRFDAPVIQAPPQAGGWRWQGAPLAAEAQLTNPWHIRFAAPGHHVLTAPVAGITQTWTADAGAADGYFNLIRSGGLEEAGLSLGGVALQLPAVGGVKLQQASVVLDPRLGPAGRPGESDVAVKLTVDGLVLPQSRMPMLGNRLDRLDLDALLRGLVPPGPPSEALKAWRDAGGTLEVHRAEAQWGALELAGDGTFALDKEMQPMGAMSAAIKGLDQAIEGLASANVISGQEARMAEIASSALAKPAADGSGKEVRMPLRIQERTVFLGPLKLMRLPPVQWE